MATMHPAFKTAEIIYASEIVNFIREIKPISHRQSFNCSQLSSQNDSPTSKHRNILRMRKERKPRYGSSIDSKLKGSTSIDNPIYLLKKRTVRLSRLPKSVNNHSTPTSELNDVRKTESPKLPLIRNISPLITNRLVPFEIIRSSRGSHLDKHKSRDVQIDAIDKLMSVCKDVEEIPKVSKQVNKEVKVIRKFNERLNWTTDTLKQFEDYDHTVIRGMFHHFSLIKEDLIHEISEIATNMKSGASNHHYLSSQRRRKTNKKEY